MAPKKLLETWIKVEELISEFHCVYCITNEFMDTCVWLNKERKLSGAQKQVYLLTQISKRHKCSYTKIIHLISKKAPFHVQILPW